MKHAWPVIVLLVVATFALPTITHGVYTLLPAVIGLAVLGGIGFFVYKRARRW